jgi:hypothetical protein
MAITNGYCTLAQLKASADITDSYDDTILELAIEAASREIDQMCERNFYNMGTATRDFVAQDAFYTPIDDLITLTTLKTDPNGDSGFSETWAASDFTTLPLNGFLGGIQWPSNGLRVRDTYLFPTVDEQPLVRVTGVWGWTSVPTPVVQATIILASRLHKRNDSPLGVAGFGDIGVIRVGSYDPDVEKLIHPFKKVKFA